MYDNASESYSESRYFGRVDSYIKYLFATRQARIIDFFRLIYGRQEILSVFEVGCADGALFRRLQDVFPDKLSRLAGVDISQKMLDVARRETAGVLTPDFYLRGREPEDPDKRYDVVVETGVHIENLESELAYIQSHLVKQGYTVISLASSKSLFTRFKLTDKAYVRDYLSYKRYREMLEKHFKILGSKSYCLFIPKLWAIPILARLLQPALDHLLAPFVPELFHEKLYLLRLRT